MTTHMVGDNEYEIQASMLRGSWSNKAPIPYRQYIATRFLKFPFKFRMKEKQQEQPKLPYVLTDTIKG